MGLGVCSHSEVVELVLTYRLLALVQTFPGNLMQAIFQNALTGLLRRNLTNTEAVLWGTGAIRLFARR